MKGPSPIRVYSRLLEPTEHPDYTRRAVRPPSWSLVGGQTQFTCLRTFDVKDDRIVGFVEEIEKYTRTYELGTVIWPSYPVLFAKNLGELAQEIKHRGLFLFDIWGYVPGSGPGGYWRQFKVPTAQLELLESILGERWLGTDIGEQDGRYINGYAGQMTPASSDHFEQYLNFQRHFERMGDDLGHKHATLVSLNFGHYFLKEGTYTLIGAETAQALPNNQVYYAFIRGAGKQYGVPWFGNASVWNRWGFKSYTPPGKADGFDFSPTKGTSLSLLKRLLYTHLMYNGMFAGFETGWIEGNELTPVGKIQQSAVRWIKEHGSPGVMHTPVALLVDFMAGWSFPRHLYTERVYRVWGNLPYGPGDFLTDRILDLLYPGYANSSYFHDESGFNAPTPFGDIADCLLSDAQSWLLERYPVLVIAGELSGGAEVRDKLESYVRNGGHLVLTSGNLGKFPEGLAGVTSVEQTTELSHGSGQITIFASPFGVEPVDFQEGIRNEVDRPLDRPFKLNDEVRRSLEEIFRSQMLFEVEGEGLSVVSCRKKAGEYTVSVANNTWTCSSYRLTPRCGAFESVAELTLDNGEKSEVGYLPEGVSSKQIGMSGPGQIAGGDIRIFSIRVKEEGVFETPHRVPPPRASNRWLPLRETRSIKESILSRPTFFEHFDGVVVDWRMLHDRESSTLREESRWIARQSLRVAVDLSSGVNFYPTLRLVDNQLEDFPATITAIDRVLAKMEIIGARDLILSLHRAPENNFTPEQATVALEQTLKDLAAKAAGRDITIHLRVTFEKAPQRIGDLAALIDRAALGNLKLAPSTSVLAAEGGPSGQLARQLEGKVGLWLYAAMKRDLAGHPYDFHAPVYRETVEEQTRLRDWLNLAPGLPVVFDALLGGSDSEYFEARALASETSGQTDK